MCPPTRIGGHTCIKCVRPGWWTVFAGYPPRSVVDTILKTFQHSWGIQLGPSVSVPALDVGPLVGAVCSTLSDLICILSHTSDHVEFTHAIRITPHPMRTGSQYLNNRELHDLGVRHVIGLELPPRSRGQGSAETLMIYLAYGGELRPRPPP